MNDFVKKYEKLMRRSKSVVITMITAKFLFGLGLGMLLASYLQEYQ